MPSGAHVRAAMIAHCADHAELQIIEGDLVRQVARVENGVVMTTRTRAADEILVYPKARCSQSGSGLSCSHRLGIVHGMLKALVRVQAARA